MAIKLGAWRPPNTHPSEPPRGMYPGEFVDILQTYLHPRWWSIWVESNRWGRRQREAVGLPTDLATVFVAGVAGEKEQALVVPTGQFPFITTYEVLLDEEGNEEIGRWAAKGWPAALEHLIQHGYLRPAPRLSYLIGKDSFKLPRISPDPDTLPAYF